MCLYIYVFTLLCTTGCSNWQLYPTHYPVILDYAVLAQSMWLKFLHLYCCGLSDVCRVNTSRNTEFNLVSFNNSLS
jgi:hypothetical protein